MDDLIERDAERAALDAALAAMGRLVVIEAAPGLGKTRLLRALREAARGSGALVLTARGSELESQFAFGLVHQLLDSAVAPALFEGAARLAEPIFAEAVHPEGEELLPLLHGLTWLVTGLAAQRPLVLLCDDAQWGDEPSLRFLAFLAKRIDGLPILLAVATRPHGRDPALAELTDDPEAQVLRPRALSVAGVAAYLDLAGADPALAPDCHASTNGNPFYLGELAREITAGAVPTSAPRTVATAIERRLRDDPDALALARAVAVLGDGADAPALAGLDPHAADAAARTLVRAGVFEEALAFAHPIVRSAIYASIPTGERGAAHATAATLLKRRGARPERYAGHLLAAPPAGDPDVVNALRDAARRARELGGARSAAAYLSRALAEPPPESERVPLLTELGAAAARAGDPAAIWHLEQAIELASDEPARAAAALELARVLKFRGESVKAVPILDARAPLDEALEIERLGLAYLSVGARHMIDTALREPHEPPTTRLEAFTLAALAFDAGARGEDVERVARLADRALTGDLLPPDPLAGGYGLLIAGVALLWADRLDQAERLYARLRAEAQRQGSAVLLAAAAGQSALVNERRGALAEASADAADALALADETTGTEALLSSARAAHTLAALARGEDASIEVDDAQADTMPFMLVLYARAELRLARGDLDGGLQDLRACGAHGRSWGAENPSVAPWRSRMASVLAGLGRYDEAHALVSEELTLARAFGAPRAIGVALRVAGTVGAVAPVPALTEAVAVLESSPAQLELARALVDLGAARRRRGERAASRAPLSRGLELATRCGAAPLAARAHEELLAAGARPRRIALSGMDALTPSERRVAALAADGLSNRMIAQQLFVTEKTVESHLRGAFQKLDISSRTALPRFSALSPN